MPRAAAPPLWRQAGRAGDVQPAEGFRMTLLFLAVLEGDL